MKQLQHFFAFASKSKNQLALRHETFRVDCICGRKCSRSVSLYRTSKNPKGNGAVIAKGKEGCDI
jgi:hypothetical protein